MADPWCLVCVWLSTPETIMWYRIDPMHADVMVVRYFIDAVKCGAFTDYDGTEDRQTNVHAVPILIRCGACRVYACSLVWYIVDWRCLVWHIP